MNALTNTFLPILMSMQVGYWQMATNMGQISILLAYPNQIYMFTQSNMHDM